MNDQSRNAQGRRDEYVQLRHLAAELPVGTTDNRQACPFCQGGRNGDRGFSITRISEAEAKYCCHRATCGKAGRIATWGFRLQQEHDPSTSQRKEFTPRVYSGNTGELGTEWVSELLYRYDLSSGEAAWANWREDIDSKRLVCPIYSPGLVLRGVELRLSKQYSTAPGPKTSHYRAIDEVWMGWYRRFKTGPVLLVEDCISALKGARYFQTAAILGSHLSLDHIVEAIEVSQGAPVLVALDKDATYKAIKFISQWRFIAPNFRPCLLKKDLKYYTDEEISALNPLD